MVVWTHDDTERINNVREGFNEFFDWHMRGYVEYRTADQNLDMPQ